MATLTPKKLDLTQINNGEEYINGDSVQASAINSALQSSAFTQALVTNEVDDSKANNVGTPRVYIAGQDTENPHLVFENLKGESARTPVPEFNVGDTVSGSITLYPLWENFNGVQYTIVFASGEYISCYGQTATPTIGFYNSNGESVNGVNSPAEQFTFTLSSETTISSMGGSYYGGGEPTFLELFSLVLDEDNAEYIYGANEFNQPSWYKRKKESTESVALYRHTVSLSDNVSALTVTIISSKATAYTAVGAFIYDMGKAIYPCIGTDPGGSTNYTVCQHSSGYKISLYSVSGSYDVDCTSIESDIVEQL